eukprot:3575781-Pleurochrysis_carterae.AAC.1
MQGLIHLNTPSSLSERNLSKWCVDDIAGKFRRLHALTGRARMGAVSECSVATLEWGELEQSSFCESQ